MPAGVGLNTVPPPCVQSGFCPEGQASAPGQPGRGCETPPRPRSAPSRVHQDSVLLGRRGRREPPGLRGAALRARRRQCLPGLRSRSTGSEQNDARTGATARAGPRQAAWWVPCLGNARGCRRAEGGSGAWRGCPGPASGHPRRRALVLFRVWAPGRVCAGQAGGAKAGLQPPSAPPFVCFLPVTQSEAGRRPHGE